MLIWVLSRINKLCHFLINFKQSHKYNLSVCQILSLLSTFGPKNNLEFGSCLEYCSTFHFPYYHKCPFGNVKKIVVVLGLSPKPMTPPPPRGTDMTVFHFSIYDSRPPPIPKGHKNSFQNFKKDLGSPDPSPFVRAYVLCMLIIQDIWSKGPYFHFLAVQDSSIGDRVTHSLSD